MQLSRRQVIAGGGAAVAAWVIPEITAFSPSAAGATLSAPAGGFPQPEAIPAAAPPAQAAPPTGKAGPPLAMTGADIEQTTIGGAALIAAGWAATHWAARTKGAPR